MGHYRSEMFSAEEERSDAEHKAGMMPIEDRVLAALKDCEHSYAGDEPNGEILVGLSREEIRFTIAVLEFAIAAKRLIEFN